MPLRRFLNSKLSLLVLGTGLLFGYSAHAGEWRQHEAHLMEFATKIGGLQKEMNELIEEKQKSKSAEERQKLNDTLVKKWADLKKVNDEMDAEKLHIRFKHPEKGDATERKYSRFQIKPLSEMESDMGVDGRLDRIKKKVEAKFDVKAEPSKQEMDEERRPASAKQIDSDRIVLKK